MDEYDIMAPMFDEELHANKRNAIPTGSICPFCNTEFPNHAKNLYHLGYHGFPIALPVRKQAMDPEKGEEGICLGIRKKTKRNRKQPSCAALEALADDLRLIDIKKN